MEKISLPIKTKVTACLMIISGIIGFLNIGTIGAPPLLETHYGLAWARYIILFPPFLFEDFFSIPGVSIFVYLLIIYFSIGAFLIFPIFLFKRKKWAWWINIINLSLSLIFLIFFFFHFSSFPKHWVKDPLYSLFYPLFFLILLLLDRKNFWKIAS
jgi:hypothetical protein